MNFSYGIITTVGVLVAISIGFIAMSPDEIIEPRMTSMEEKLPGCTKQWEPVCGVDGETYGNSCTLDAADVKLDYVGECVAKEKPVACNLEWNPICGVDGETYVNPCALNASGVTLDYEGECVVPDPEVVEEVVEPEPETQSDLPMSLTISSPEGSGVLGCEENNECYLPYEVTIAVGATVTWSNDDAAAHTVTSGTPADGPDGIFDSGLFMSGGTFEFTFEETGTYDYFCMVHPWMTGIIHVE